MLLSIILSFFVFSAFYLPSINNIAYNSNYKKQSEPDLVFDYSYPTINQSIKSLSFDWSSFTHFYFNKTVINSYFENQLNYISSYIILKTSSMKLYYDLNRSLTLMNNEIFPTNFVILSNQEFNYVHNIIQYKNNTEINYLYIYNYNGPLFPPKNDSIELLGNEHNISINLDSVSSLPFGRNYDNNPFDSFPYNYINYFPLSIVSNDFREPIILTNIDNFLLLLKNNLRVENIQFEFHFNFNYNLSKYNPNKISNIPNSEYSTLLARTGNIITNNFPNTIVQLDQSESSFLNLISLKSQKFSSNLKMFYYFNSILLLFISIIIIDISHSLYDEFTKESKLAKVLRILEINGASKEEIIFIKLIILIFSLLLGFLISIIALTPLINSSKLDFNNLSILIILGIINFVILGIYIIYENYYKKNHEKPGFMSKDKSNSVLNIIEYFCYPIAIILIIITYNLISYNFQIEVIITSNYIVEIIIILSIQVILLVLISKILWNYKLYFVIGFKIYLVILNNFKKSKIIYFISLSLFRNFKNKKQINLVIIIAFSLIFTSIFFINSYNQQNLIHDNLALGADIEITTDNFQMSNNQSYDSLLTKIAFNYNLNIDASPFLQYTRLGSTSTLFNTNGINKTTGSDINVLFIDFNYINHFTSYKPSSFDLFTNSTENYPNGCLMSTRLFEKLDLHKKVTPFQITTSNYLYSNKYQTQNYTSIGVFSILPRVSSINPSIDESIILNYTNNIGNFVNETHFEVSPHGFKNGLLIWFKDRPNTLDLDGFLKQISNEGYQYKVNSNIMNTNNLANYYLNPSFALIFIILSFLIVILVVNSFSDYVENLKPIYKSMINLNYKSSYILFCFSFFTQLISTISLIIGFIVGFGLAFVFFSILLIFNSGQLEFWYLNFNIPDNSVLILIITYIVTSLVSIITIIHKSFSWRTS